MTIRTRTAPERSRRLDPDLVSYRAVALPSGRLLPIEVRIGRRILRTISAESAEGKKLLKAGKVQIVEAGD